MANPGSPEAVAKGCTCAILDNSYGKGYMGQKGVFSINLSCLIHGETTSTFMNEKICAECGERNDNFKVNFPTCSKCINEKMTGGAD